MIPTAEEFLNDKLSEIHEEEIFEDLLQRMFTVDVSEVLIAFAKLHVEAFRQELLEKGTILGEKISNSWEMGKPTILNSYPLENIK
jgi:hypothetical protein